MGFGAYSTEILVTTDNTPTRVNTPTNTQTDYNKIYLSWNPITSAVDTGGDPVIYYYVDFYDRPCYVDDSNDCASENIALGLWKEISTESV